MKVAGGCPSTVEVEFGGSNSGGGGGVTWTQVRFKKEKDGSVASWLDGAVPQHGRCCKLVRSYLGLLSMFWLCVSLQDFTFNGPGSCIAWTVRNGLLGRTSHDEIRA